MAARRRCRCSAALRLGRVLGALVVLSPPRGGASESEPERLQERQRRGLAWPPLEAKPGTATYQELLLRREAQIMALPKGQERWDGWMNLAKMVTVPNFTETGFKLVDAPPALHKELLEALHAGMGTSEETVEEGQAHVSEIEVDGQPAIQGKAGRPKFVKAHELMKKVLKELQPMHEAWAGIDLEPSNAYGFRIYKNMSSLMMHVDRLETHVVSSIFHIDHKYDDDAVPWPIQIEDLNGNVQAIDLKPGQMLFYESAKCMHGRPTQLRGGYYVSVFVHYRPTGWPIQNADARLAVPPHHADDVRRHPGLAEYAAALPQLRGASTGLIDRHAFKFDSVMTRELPPIQRTFDEMQTVRFTNKAGVSVDAFWISPEGNEHYKGSIAPGKQLWQNTGHGHRFRFKQEGGDITEHVMDFASAGLSYVVGRIEL